MTDATTQAGRAPFARAGGQAEAESCGPVDTRRRIGDDISRVRVGDAVRLHYVCHATLWGRAKALGDGTLVLDIPGDNFVVRHPDGRHCDGVERVELLDARS